MRIVSDQRALLRIKLWGIALMQMATELFKLERRTVLHWTAEYRLVLGFQGEADLIGVQISTPATE